MVGIQELVLARSSNLMSKSKHGKPMMVRKTRKILTREAFRDFFRFQISCESGNTYSSKKCVCALPKQVMERMTSQIASRMPGGPLFSGIRRDLDRIECGSLCRIYCTFDRGADGKVWFHDLGKITTDNDLRMVCLLYTSPSPRDRQKSRMPSSA